MTYLQITISMYTKLSVALRSVHKIWRQTYRPLMQHQSITRMVIVRQYVAMATNTYWIGRNREGTGCRIMSGTVAGPEENHASIRHGYCCPGWDMNMGFPKVVRVLSSYLTLQSPVVTICTTRLTLNNSTFCPHSIYVLCVDLRTNSDYFPIQH